MMLKNWKPVLRFLFLLKLLQMSLFKPRMFSQKSVESIETCFYTEPL